MKLHSGQKSGTFVVWYNVVFSHLHLMYPLEGEGGYGHILSYKYILSNNVWNMSVNKNLMANCGHVTGVGSSLKHSASVTHTYQVIPICLLQPHILQAVLTNPQLWLFAVFLRVWTEIPRIDLVSANLYPVNVFHFCNSFMFFLEGSCCWIHFCICLKETIGILHKICNFHHNWVQWSLLT